MNAQVTAVKQTQPAIPEIEKAEKILYYLLVKTEKGKLTINVGEKTYKEITELTTPYTGEKGGKKKD